MPTRAHRPALTRTHSRSSSGGGSSKVGLNLQITQKDAPPPAALARDKSKQHLRHEPAARTSTFSRTGSAHHLPTREREQPPYPRRAPPPQGLTSTKPSDKPKAGFRLSSTSDGDDDEWESSESGAATPSGSTDSEGEETTTPVEPQKGFPAQIKAVREQHAGTQVLDPPTPRAETPRLPRIETARQQPLSPLVPAQRDYAPSPKPQQSPQQQARQQRQQPSQLSRTANVHESIDPRPPHVEAQPPAIQQQHPMQPVQKALSETNSPPRKMSPEYKRQAMTRPPSTHSVTKTDAPLRPHPLIRGHSYGAGAVLSKPTTLAPLTVSNQAAQAEMSTVTSPSSLRAGSPTSIKTTSAASPQLSTSSSQASKQLRRTSTSSVQSPLPPSVSSNKQDRQRTLSSMSSSSSFAALSHLNLGLRSTPSPSRMHHERSHITAHFPPAEQAAALESIHSLLPPPYLMAHLTVLQYRNPIADSYNRVSRAKQRL